MLDPRYHVTAETRAKSTPNMRAIVKYIFLFKDASDAIENVLKGGYKKLVIP